jgi:hypothetical protein
MIDKHNLQFDINIRFCFCMTTCTTNVLSLEQFQTLAWYCVITRVELPIALEPSSCWTAASVLFQFLQDTFTNAPYYTITIAVSCRQYSLARHLTTQCTHLAPLVPMDSVVVQRSKFITLVSGHSSSPSGQGHAISFKTAICSVNLPISSVSSPNCKHNKTVINGKLRQTTNIKKSFGHNK